MNGDAKAYKTENDLFYRDNIITSTMTILHYADDDYGQLHRLAVSKSFNKTALSSIIDIFHADDVIFAEIGTRLHFNQL